MNANRWLCAALAALLSACASLPEDGGLSRVSAIAGPRVPAGLVQASTPASQARLAAQVRDRLAKPLSAGDAVAIALLNSPSLQVAYAELGLAEADLVQAGRMRNPGFSFTRLKRGAEREIERTWSFDLLWLVTMPWRVGAEQAMVASQRTRAATDIARTAHAARRAWVEAVAASELARYAFHVSDSAAGAAELAAEMARAGNFNRLALSREQLFQADAVAQLARARHAETAARERLVRVLGLWGEEAAALTLPERLPDLPPEPRELRDAEALAIEGRLDVQQARAQAESIAALYGVGKATRFVNVLHLGYERNSTNEGHKETGYEVELEVPIFDWGDAKLARTESAYRQATFRLAEVAVLARSEVRESWSAYRTAHDLARHYREEIVPLRARIAEENLLRYNGMLIGVFELLADAHDQVRSVMSAIEATRDFWVADAHLEMALTGASPGEAPAMAAAPARGAAAPGGH
jgi:outer membrane protein TolC